MTDSAITIGNLMMSCLQGAVNNMDSAIRPGEVCFRIGSEVAFDADQFTDLCCLGLAYITPLDQQTSGGTSFPEQEIVRQAQARCAPPAWGFQWKAGIARCVPVNGPGGDGTMPTCTQWTEAYVKNLADAQALRQFVCCFRQAFLSTPEFLGMSIVIERQVQGPVQGGCVERSVTMWTQVINCDCPGQG